MVSLESILTCVSRSQSSIGLQDRQKDSSQVPHNAVGSYELHRMMYAASRPSTPRDLALLVIIISSRHTNFDSNADDRSSQASCLALQRRRGDVSTVDKPVSANEASGAQSVAISLKASPVYVLRCPAPLLILGHRHVYRPHSPLRCPPSSSLHAAKKKNVAFE